MTRTAYPEVPPRVEYALTEEGRTLRPIVASGAVWFLEMWIPKDPHGEIEVVAREPYGWIVAVALSSGGGSVDRMRHFTRRTGPIRKRKKMCARRLTPR